MSQLTVFTKTKPQTEAAVKTTFTVAAVTSPALVTAATLCQKSAWSKFETLCVRIKSNHFKMRA